MATTVTSTAKPKAARASLKIVSCSEVVEQQEQRRRATNKPQPWVLRKLTILIVVALFGWSTYVYVARVCVAMIMQHPGAVGGKGLGIVFLVFFALLWVMFLWTYLYAILTPPGFARDHVSKTERPGPPSFPEQAYQRLQPAPARTRPPPRRQMSDPWSASDHDLIDEAEWERAFNDKDPQAYAMASASVIGIGSVKSPRPSADLEGRDPGADIKLEDRHRSGGWTSAEFALQTHEEGFEIEDVDTEQGPTVSGTPSSNNRSRERPSTTTRTLSPPRSNPGAQYRKGRASDASSTSHRVPSPLSNPRGSDSRPQPGSLSPLHNVSSAMSLGTERTAETDATLIQAITPDATGTTHNTRNDDHDPEGLRKLKSDGGRLSPIGTQPNTPQPNTPSARDGVSLADFLNSTGPPSAATGQYPPQPAALASRRASADLPPPLYSRRPPTTPVLDEEYRYCSRDGLVKPYRTHHCRVCGTCVLYYDHHCPWIGQCVGARNRKFFVNFLFWCTLYAVWLVATLLPIAIISGARGGGIGGGGTDGVDGQVIGVIILSILFGFFAFSLLVTHIHLLRYNASTVEWYGFQRMEERERALLGEMFPPCIGGPCGSPRDPWDSQDDDDSNSEKRNWDPAGSGKTSSWLCRPNGQAHKGKRATRKAWDAEWGRIRKEGNIWWLEDGKRANWEQVMGSRVLEWVFPIKVRGVDWSALGLKYTPNPRFDEFGRWRKRSEWPEELQ